ncbi:MAG TPA: AraC family transcriptional regulator [Chitinispirillaceae bacterium]|nr:AraC family transcriptional regulator [Chitinispirillaceae bacterium]
MSAYTLPHYFKKYHPENMVDISSVASVLHNQSVDQECVSVCITRSMFAMILNGKKIIHTTKGDIKIGAGEMFFAQRGTYLLSERMSIDNDYSSMIFFFDDRYIHQFARRYASLLNAQQPYDRTMHGIYKIEKFPLMHHWAESVLPVYETEYQNRNELLRVKIEELMLLLINSAQRDQFIAFLQSVLNSETLNLELYMTENFTLPLTLDEFAKQTGRSLTRFKQDFKTIFTLPPKQWINAQRLERAHTLLVNTNCSVSEICYECGFENLSHFIQLFSKHYGITPKKLQQREFG